MVHRAHQGRAVVVEVRRRSIIPSWLRSSRLSAAGAFWISSAESSPSRLVSSATKRGGSGGRNRLSPEPLSDPPRRPRDGGEPSSGGPGGWARASTGVSTAAPTKSRLMSSSLVIRQSPSEVLSVRPKKSEDREAVLNIVNEMVTHSSWHIFPAHATGAIGYQHLRRGFP